MWMMQLLISVVRGLAFVAFLTMVVGCASTASHKSGKTAGGWKSGQYYQNDGPASLANIDLESIADAVPKDEKIISATTRPYSVLGRTYTPMKTRAPYKERGEISWYGKQYHERTTSTGEIYDMFAMSAAHPTLPLPSYVRVTNLENGKSVVVRVNDRGPFLQGRILDLSFVAAAKLGYVNRGTTMAEIEAVFPNQPLPEKPKINVEEPPPAQTITPIINSTAEILPPNAVFIPTTAIDSPRKSAPAASIDWVNRSQIARGEYWQIGAFAQPASAESQIEKLQTQLPREPLSRIHIIRLADDDQKFKIWLSAIDSADQNQIANWLRVHKIDFFKINH